MRESASTDLRDPQGSNPLGPPGRNSGLDAPDHTKSAKSKRLEETALSDILYGT